MLGSVLDNWVQSMKRTKIFAFRKLRIKWREGERERKKGREGINNHTTRQIKKISGSEKFTYLGVCLSSTYNP